MGERDIKHSNFPWLAQEFQLIKDALNKKIKIIGICLGTQLLAHAAGGNVEILINKSSSQPLSEIG